MGQSANAHVVFGVGWGAEEAPPAFSDERWGGWDIEKALAFHAPPERYADEPTVMDEDSWDELEWLETLVDKLVDDGLLDTHYVGYMDLSGSSVFVKRTKCWSWDYGFNNLKLEEPTTEELRAIHKIAKELGYEPEQVGWKFFACYG